MNKTVSKTRKTDRELCRIIATSMSDIVRNSLNPTFRQNYFDAVRVCWSIRTILLILQNNNKNRVRAIGNTLFFFSDSMAQLVRPDNDIGEFLHGTRLNVTIKIIRSVKSLRFNNIFDVIQENVSVCIIGLFSGKSFLFFLFFFYRYVQLFAIKFTTIYNYFTVTQKCLFDMELISIGRNAHW